MTETERKIKRQEREFLTRIMGVTMMLVGIALVWHGLSCIGEEIDKHGGLKAVVERVWRGK